MESYHVPANSRISPRVRVDSYPPCGGHCHGPYLDWGRAHGGARLVALYDRGRVVGCPHRLAGGRSVPRRGKYLCGNDRDVCADHTVRLVDPSGCGLGMWLSENMASLVSAIPLPFIVAAQVYRVGGGIFLVLWAGGHLPWQFALPAGVGDVLTGCFAVVVATLLAQNAVGARRTAYAWCIFGIADLAVAVTMGAMTAPGLPHLLALDAPNLLITSYPLVMVPTFAVPLALMLHGLVLWRLRRETAPTGWAL